MSFKVLTRGIVLNHSRQHLYSFASKRNISWTPILYNSEQKTTPQNHKDTKPTSQQTPDNTNPKDTIDDSISHISKKAVGDFLDQVRPYLDRAHHHYKVTSDKLEGVTKSLGFHWNKAKEAIKEANQKLELQEKESQSYAFNEDLSSSDKNKTIKGLPSDREKHRRLWAKKLELYIDSLQETIFTATRALNDVTGYSSIQKLRESIDVLEKDLEKAKEAAKLLKIEHNDAILKRLETQKEVNLLLQRQSSWTPTDVERFTKLYKEDHENANAEEEAKEKMEKAEAHEEELQDKLSNAILTRYHEEQIWSDKIRRTSTWGTFGLMGINILLFLVFQLALEPWKRRRLVGNFEQKVQKALEENTNSQNERLDIMSQKVEALKESDRLSAFEGRLESEIFDADDDIVEPPIIRQLPLPKVELTFKEKVWNYLTKVLDKFKPCYELIFYKNVEAVTIHKNEIASSVSATLLFGIVIGTCISCIYR